MKIDGEVYYTVLDVAEFCEVKVTTVNGWVTARDLAPDRTQVVGRATRNLFHEDTVKAFLQKRYGS